MFIPKIYGALMVFDFSFMLYFRLFMVAGVSWILEIIWFVVPFNNTIFFLGDLFNSLQGVFIFILFVIMKRRVLRLIKKRYVSLTHIIWLDFEWRTSFSSFKLDGMHRVDYQIQLKVDCHRVMKQKTICG